MDEELQYAERAVLLRIIAEQRRQIAAQTELAHASERCPNSQTVLPGGWLRWRR